MPVRCAMRRAAALLLLVATPVQAQLCDGAGTPIGADGRALGHLPYGDVAETELADAPPGFAIGQPCRVRRDMIPDLTRLLAAAAGDPAVMGQLRAISCHRSIVRQSAVFCRERGRDAADRAISVAPPGHSEHATGYALDFTVRPADGCPDAEACMAAKPAFRWLMANAPRHGFELSFPVSNTQNVKWEPWHWRWVGTTVFVPGAARARALFARARRDFPGNPQIVVPPRVFATIAPPVPVVVPEKGRKPKRRRSPPSSSRP